jgi:quinol monooxygenase YgiN
MPEDREVVVTAMFSARDGQEDELERRLSELVTKSQRDSGCIAYALHRGIDDPLSYAMVERWRSRGDLDAHLSQPHVAAVAEALDLLAEAPRVLFAEPVVLGDPEKGALR